MTGGDRFPILRTVGTDGLLVTFADRMSEEANRAALAFRSAIAALDMPGIVETATSLASAYLRFDPVETDRDTLSGGLRALMAGRDWYGASLPEGRRLWRVPTVYGTGLAPQLDEAAAAAGLTRDAAIDRLAAARVRVLTIGFAPGQPYLGPLGPEFDLPRLDKLTPMVPAGALVLAISQLVLFSNPSPTGWRHVGQTGFRCFDPGRARPFALSPGDEMQFEPVSGAELERLARDDPGGLGGAVSEEIVA